MKIAPPLHPTWPGPGGHPSSPPPPPPPGKSIPWSHVNIVMKGLGSFTIPDTIKRNSSFEAKALKASVG